MVTWMMGQIVVMHVQYVMAKAQKNPGAWLHLQIIHWLWPIC